MRKNVPTKDIMTKLILKLVRMYQLEREDDFDNAKDFHRMAHALDEILFITNTATRSQLDNIWEYVKSAVNMNVPIDIIVGTIIKSL